MLAMRPCADEALATAKEAALHWAQQAQRDAVRFDREKARIEQQNQERRVRIWMFTYEAVELYRRWAQYVEQAHSGGFSFSLPYEWTTPAMVSEFLTLGGDEAVIRAVYRVKQLNHQVVNAMRRTQDAHARGAPVENRAPAFILAPRERDVAEAVELLLDLAERSGFDVKELRRTFVQDRNIIQGQGPA